MKFFVLVEYESKKMWSKFDDVTLAYSRVSNRRGGRNKRGGWQISVKQRGGCNKRGGWQKSPRLINEEVGINGEAGKNTTIRNFIEIKSSNDLVKISTKRI